MGNGEINLNDGARCPACRRFIGPLDTCPYCDSPANKAFSLRFLRYAALALAIIGMAILYLMARSGRTPAIDLGAITPALNSATVRVEGIVAAAPRIGQSGDTYVSFPISNGSNRLMVAAYDPCAHVLVERNLLPHKGDQVDISGTISLRSPGANRIIIETPQQLKVIRPAAQHNPVQSQMRLETNENTAAEDKGA